MMKGKRTLTVLAVLIAATVSWADWQGSYATAVAAAKEGKWAEAREAFQKAAGSRAADSNQATRLPGPVTEPVMWAGGSLYSANFGAAYSGFRVATGLSGDEKTALLATVAMELKALIDKGQAAPETVFVLGKVYDHLGDNASKDGLAGIDAKWKVDSSFLLAEDRAPGSVAPQQGNGQNQQGGGQQPTKTNDGANLFKVKAGEEDRYESIIGATVSPREDKFALIVGNTESKIAGESIPFAADDAAVIADSLKTHAGYKEENIVVLANASAAQFLAASQLLAEKLPSGAVVTIFYTGVGTHLGGRDYYVGSDAEFNTDTTKMVEKLAILRPFFDKGARVYLFNQMNRRIVAGDFFGKERILIGRLAESHAAIAGQTIGSLVEDGKSIGIYTLAYRSVLKRFFTNDVPIGEFSWSVFYAVRQGTSFGGSGGGGTTQTPTLPTLLNIDEKSGF